MSIFSPFKKYVYFPLRFFLYRRSIPRKVARLRRKGIAASVAGESRNRPVSRNRPIRRNGRIRALFIIHDLASWKSELLYREMLRHPSFEPLICVTASREEDDTAAIRRYLDERGYGYGTLGRTGSLRRAFNPDIIFYQKPYDRLLPHRMEFRRNLYALSCYVNYAFHSIDEPWVYDSSIFENSWQVYFENDAAAVGYRRQMGPLARNLRITGLPMMDELNMPSECFVDPWKPQPGPRKRVIIAPHYSIGDCYTHQSTFLEYFDFLPELAQRYADTVQFAFKPHPLLRERLYALWGRERTDGYYEQWDRMPNAQLFEGRYIDLFKYSDAMVHDCVSFAIEYHYTRNPVLFLCREGEDLESTLNTFALEARQLHYRAHSSEDIVRFIDELLLGNDPLRSAREAFYRTELLPPGAGQEAADPDAAGDGSEAAAGAVRSTAAENIIDAILEG